MKRIRWVGHPSPFEDPNIVKMLEVGRIPLPMALAFRKFEHHRRVPAVVGRSEFSVGLAHGFSRTYRWLPHQELEMTEEDWQLLCRHPLDRYMFLDVTDISPPQRPLLQKRQWQELIEAAETAPEPTILRVG
jgi:hypothetical protein